MEKKPGKKPLPQDIPTTPYYADIPLTRLLLGVDNLRYDVFLSPGFSQAASNFAFQLILKHSDASVPLQTKQKINWFVETDRFKTACTEVMTDAINQAKSASEVQIDYLAQAALVKKLIAETENQYDCAIRHFKSVIRRHEVDYRTGTHLRLREEVFTIIQKRSLIIQQAGAELFEYFLEARQELNELRAINFGADALLAEELFSNPLLNAPYRPDDFFMISNYVLTGYRLEDPLNYSTLISLLKKFFTETGMAEQTEPDRIIKNPANMDLLFNFFDTRSLLYKEKKKRQPDTGRVKDLAARSGAQKKMLQMIYREFKREKLLECIVAVYEVPKIAQEYCPPLSPQELLQYLVVPRARKNIARKVKRFKKYTGKKISLSRLKKARRFVRVSGEQKKKRLVRFLKDFAAYHRDLENYHLFNEKADCIYLAEDDRTVRLSRENNTLYEFLFPKEHETGKHEIAGHVVIKADVRGSTEIIDRMKARGLNPASNFSLNFFDPINRLLPRYGAHKIFIEGDAVILSIFEYATTPARSYSVARACGLSVQMALLV
ncbi:MAG: hypothetical protein KGY38_05890, partial [Desulfobacterales bacterium]|nr:hypothetical protein [Desulfobacterales bacterium]